MPDAPEHPVTVEALYVVQSFNDIRSATVADLVSALRAEGVLHDEGIVEAVREAIYAANNSLEGREQWRLHPQLVPVDVFARAVLSALVELLTEKAK